MVEEKLNLVSGVVGGWEGQICHHNFGYYVIDPYPIFERSYREFQLEIEVSSHQLSQKKTCQGQNYRHRLQNLGSMKVNWLLSLGQPEVSSCPKF